MCTCCLLLGAPLEELAICQLNLMAAHTPWYVVSVASEFHEAAMARSGCGAPEKLQFFTPIASAMARAALYFFIAPPRAGALLSTDLYAGAVCSATA